MENINYSGVTMAHSNSLLTATGAETVHDTTVRLDFSIGGKMYSKSGTNADQATPTTDYNTGATFTALTANQGTVMVWGYNSDGTVKCMMGSIETLSGGTFLESPQFPSIPADICPFAYQVLKAGATAGTVAFGTSNWNATGFTNAIVNVATLPNRPQVA